jgi:hypothetical protein
LNKQEEVIMSYYMTGFACALEKLGASPLVDMAIRELERELSKKRPSGYKNLARKLKETLGVSPDQLKNYVLPGAALGTTGGAITGAIADRENRLRGALVGGVSGLGAGTAFTAIPGLMRLRAINNLIKKLQQGTQNVLSGKIEGVPSTVAGRYAYLKPQLETDLDKIVKLHRSAELKYGLPAAVLTSLGIGAPLAYAAGIGSK